MQLLVLFMVIVIFRCSHCLAAPTRSSLTLAFSSSSSPGSLALLLTDFSLTVLGFSLCHSLAWFFL